MATQQLRTTGLADQMVNSESISALLRNAVNTPFLERAGRGTLPASNLAYWLRQDTVYTRGYLRFLGHLLAKVHLPCNSLANVEDFSRPNREAFRLIVDALNNIEREMKFFDNVASKYKLNVFQSHEKEDDIERSHAATQYVELFDSVGDKTFAEGMCLIWATEHCYFKAWSYARSYMDQRDGSSNDRSESASNSRAALDEELIPNWTSPEFAAFVNQCNNTFDLIYQLECKFSSTHDSTLEKKCWDIWEKVLRIEADFWPQL